MIEMIRDRDDALGKLQRTIEDYARHREERQAANCAWESRAWLPCPESFHRILEPHFNQLVYLREISCFNIKERTFGKRRNLDPQVRGWIFARVLQCWFCWIIFLAVVLGWCGWMVLLAMSGQFVG
ncbi:hypothetical protein VNO80_15909 [Phaseolus coccineus]|uniref:Uncharacterized protein n=1 Tax=Phaseolus coccineus TaxID=3886 RepID=A0AAN9MPM1_PHACN